MNSQPLQQHERRKKSQMPYKFSNNAATTNKKKYKTNNRDGGKQTKRRNDKQLQINTLIKQLQENATSYPNIDPSVLSLITELHNTTNNPSARRERT